MEQTDSTQIRVNMLEGKLDKSKTTRDRIDRLNELAWELRFSDPQRALSLSLEAQQLSRTGEFAAVPYRKGQIDSLANLGRLKTDLGEYGESSRFLLEAYQYYEEFQDGAGMLRVQNSLGRIYYFIADYAQAIHHFLKANSLARTTNNEESIARSLFNIGRCYSRANEPHLAMNYFFQSLELLEARNDTLGEAFLYDGLANTYLLLNDYPKALLCSQRSVELSRKSNAHTNETDALCTMGDIHLEMGKPLKALEAYQKAIENAESCQYQIGIVQSLRRMGVTGFRNQKSSKAREYLENALVCAKDLNHLRLQYECHLSIAQFHKSQGDFEKALSHLEQYNHLFQIVFQETAEIRLRTLDVLHQLETNKQQAEINHLRNVALQEEIRKRKQVQEELEKIATLDLLTNLTNRQTFFRTTEKQVAQALRYHRPLALILFDIDDFNKINDTFGHQTGDKILREVGQLANQVVRKADLLARYGGDEFAILLPETTLARALTLAERLRERISGLKVNLPGAEVTATISLGVSEFSRLEDGSLDHLLEVADQSLLYAKKLGRNRTISLSVAQSGVKYPAT